MAEVKSTTIVPIACYCFVLAVYFLSVALNEVFGKHAILSSNDVMAWTPVITSTLFAVGLAIVGIGILQVNNLCWKILFFSLAICVSSVTSLIIAFLIFLFLGTNIVYAFVQANQIPPVEWFSFLAVFLSEIIVFYFLTREEVVANFGGMGDLISPF